MEHRIKFFFRENNGGAMVEFSLAMPILILLSLGIYEAATFIRINSKLNEAAGNIAQWMAMQPSIANAQDFLTGFNMIGSEFNFSTKASLMISGLAQVGASSNYKRVWNYGTAGAISSLVVNPSSLVTSSGITLTTGVGSLIVTEVQYKYTPTFAYFTTIFPSVTLSRTAQYIPQISIDPLSAT